MDSNLDEYFTSVEYLLDEVEEEISEEQVSDTLDFEEQLILLVQAKPFLYDLRESDYANKIKKDKEWSEIALSCGKSVDECKSRWKSLRDTFKREKKATPKSGSVGKSKKPWRYLAALDFLTPTLAQAKSNSNYRVENEEINSQMVEPSPSSTPKTKRRRIDVEEKIINLIESGLEESSNTKYALSLVGPLNRLTPKQNNLARIGIQQVLHNVEFGAGTN